MLCHGGSAHAHWWDYVAPQLVPYGRVIALDLRGHGRSEWAEIRNLRFAQIADAHHHVSLDKPAATAAAIIEFVQSLPRR